MLTVGYTFTALVLENLVRGSTHREQLQFDFGRALQPACRQFGLEISTEFRRRTTERSIDPSCSGGVCRCSCTCLSSVRRSATLRPCG